MILQRFIIMQEMKSLILVKELKFTQLPESLI